MPAVVSDTSVLHYLAAAAHFAVLRAQFKDLLIPPAVRDEVEAAGTRSVVSEVQNAISAGWIRVEAPRPGPTLSLLLSFLDKGEAEAIAPAAELSPARVLLDEADGREAARRLGIPDDLIQRHRFRLAPALYQQLVAGDPPAGQPQ